MGAFQISKGVQRYSAGMEGTKAEDPDGRDEVGFCVLPFPLSLSFSFSLSSFASISSTRRSHSGAFIRPSFPSSSRGSTNALHGWRERKLLHFRWGKNRVAISIRSPIVPQSRESNGRDGTTADALFPLPSPTPERTDGRANVEIYARAFAE